MSSVKSLVRFREEDDIDRRNKLGLVQLVSSTADLGVENAALKTYTPLGRIVVFIIRQLERRPHHRQSLKFQPHHQSRLRLISDYLC